MPNKLCVRCEEKPRKVSRTGKQLTMCNDCQREDWRKRKTPVGTGLALSAKKSRKCKSCKNKKLLSEFDVWGNKGHKTTCKQCEADKQPQPCTTNPDHAHESKRGQHLILVNGDQMVLAQIISQSDSVNNKALLIDIYRQQGYTIQAVYESEALA